MSYDDLERHVVEWGVEKLSDIREFVFGIQDEECYSEEKKYAMCVAFIPHVDALLSLLDPLRHDSDCLIEWGFNFVYDHKVRNFKGST